VHADFDRENINADFYPLFQCPNPSSDPDWNRLEQELSQNSD